jgi:hypothetical protein
MNYNCCIVSGSSGHVQRSMKTNEWIRQKRWQAHEPALTQMREGVQPLPAKGEA